MRGRNALLAVASVAVLAAAAPAASATELQDASGAPYTGPLAGALSGNAVFSSGIGTITCNQSAFAGDVTGAGSTGSPAIADVDSIDWENSGSEACTSAIPHLDLVAGALPWSVQIDGLSVNTAGDPNGVATLSGVSVTVVLDSDDTCTYAGDFNDSAGSGNQIQVDVYNPDNPGPDMRLAFSSEPFRLLSGTFDCPGTAQATATYTVTGEAGEKLRVAVDTLSDFSFGEVKKNKRKGTAKLTVEIAEGPGELALAKTKKVKADDEAVVGEGATEDELAIKPKGKTKKKLNDKGKAKVTVEVTYTPDGGEPNTQSKKVKLKKR